MRSLIILEVEHGDTTDPLEVIAVDVAQTANLLNYTVRVDLPECFVLDA